MLLCSILMMLVALAMAFTAGNFLAVVKIETRGMDPDHLVSAVSISLLLLGHAAILLWLAHCVANRAAQAPASTPTLAAAHSLPAPGAPGAPGAHIMPAVWLEWELSPAR